MTTYRQREGHWSPQPDPISVPIVNVSSRNIRDTLLVAALAASPVVLFILFLVL